MSATGFSAARAISHDERVHALMALLDDRGYSPVELRVNGDRPDIKIVDWHRSGPAYIDLKTRSSQHTRFSIKLAALREFRQIEVVEMCPVYIIWGNDRVDTPDTLASRLVGGPRRATGNGSATDWLLVEEGGTELNAFFPAPVERSAA